MPALSPSAIAELLVPYLSEFPDQAPVNLYIQLSVYLDLLLKWNARTNLTAIRDPEEIVRRHFGESLFAAWHLDSCITLLDFGSGAGFPGLPIQIFRPDIAVTLGESQNKKATFLREVIRTMGLSTEVWANRVEAMPADRRFDVVTLRAVDNMDAALEAAAPRALRELLLLAGTAVVLPNPFTLESAIRMPNSDNTVLHRAIRSINVPHGTF